MAPGEFQTLQISNTPFASGCSYICAPWYIFSSDFVLHTNVEHLKDIDHSKDVEHLKDVEHFKDVQHFQKWCREPN